MNSIIYPPHPTNEPQQTFAPGSEERTTLLERIRALKKDQVDIPAFIGGKEVRTGRTQAVRPPHELEHVLGKVHYCGMEEVDRAIGAALDAGEEWARMDWTDRAAIFLKAADLIAGPYRDTINAATMLGQSKNAYQAEIDAACELIDFLRFNVHFMRKIYEEQPISSRGVWNRMEYRPLEGFVLAVTPFNFTAIQGNLPTAPALMGNVVLWKPSTTSVYSAYFTYKILEEAGLPPGVINMLPGRGPNVGDPALSSPHLAGLHFTGSTKTFQHLWREIGTNIDLYDAYPRIVGETGGKDFIVAHPSADERAVAAAIVRGAFEYQGQKCSAASRIYLPKSQWSSIRDELLDQVGEIKVGPVEDFTNFVNAVIDHRAFEKITGYIEHAREASGVEVLAGGSYRNEDGYFIEPTVLKVDDPHYQSMREEIFGPVVSIYVYPDKEFEATLRLVDETSPYALTGSIFARDRKAIALATERLVNAAGNFYINDKPTGAVVSQQPFGGARGSGTNDKAGAAMNLLRWTSARSIKESFNPPRHFGYPHHQPEEAVSQEAMAL